MDNFEILNKLLEIQPSENLGNDIFNILKQYINIQSGYIYFINPEKLEYSYGKNDGKQKIENVLKIKNTVFGKIILTADNFDINDINNLKTCSLIISNLIKDYELSKIMNIQVETLRNGYESIKQAEQSKSKFISHISHELRTPLNSILGFSDLIQLSGDLNEKQKEYLNDIKISGLHLLEMINEILDMTKIEAGAIKLTLKEFEISQVISETINIIKPLLIKKRLVLEIEDFMIIADYQKIQQILFNILSNAIKFTKENGKIIIKTHKLKDYAVISIKDDGIGIEEKNFEKIFEKFEQLDKTLQNSTGLGLAITRELVKLHNGEITVCGALNKGAEFIIKLPLNY